MKKKLLLSLLVVVCLIGLLVALSPFIFPEKLPAASKVSDPDATARFHDQMIAANEKAQPAPAYLQAAIDSGDQVKILRAFGTLTESKQWRMSAVVPALKGFLSHPDPYVRYLAAAKLYQAGDQSGYSVLLDFVKSPAPVTGPYQDLRLAAAQALAQYRQYDAADAVSALYSQTKAGELIYALEKINPPKAAEIIAADGFHPDPDFMEHYGTDGIVQFVPQIAKIFHDPADPRKTAAAYALAVLTIDPAAQNLLVQTVEKGLKNPSATPGLALATKYLGAIRTPDAKQTLEAALDCKDPEVVRIALVNLLFTQGGSEKARQFMAAQLSNPPRSRLPWDFMLSVAATLAADPQIQATRQKFAQFDTVGDWQACMVDRQAWPADNWIDEYVLKYEK